MCGIAGIVRITPPDQAREALARSMFDAIPESWLDTLDASIKHRGPDGQGRFRDRAIRPDGSVVDVALVHRRLSIIDHKDGAQPMVSQFPPSPEGRGRGWGSASSTSSSNLTIAPLLFHAPPDASPPTPGDYRALPDVPDSLAVVFNGCIYNHRALRAELQAKGHRFVTDHSDTEVLLHGWREWGQGTLSDNDGMPARFGGLCERLSDMFAFAMWDRARATLCVARDEFGQKPNYVWDAPRGESHVFAFSSSFVGLIRLTRQIDKAIVLNNASLAQWTRFGAERSPIESLDEAFPSHLGQPTAGKTGQHWGFEWFIPLPNLEHMNGVFSDAFIWIRRHHSMNEDEAERLLRASVESRLEADVPVACFLSGGVDSSLVAAFAKDIRPDLATFSVRMPVGLFDESGFARRAAECIDAKHTTLDCDVRPAEDLISLITELGLPFGDSSLLPTHWLSRAVRSHAKVSLSGDGGDEMFAGYERYRGATWLHAWPLLALWPLGPNADPKSRHSRLHRLASAARFDRYADLVSIYPRPLWKKLVGPAQCVVSEKTPGRTVFRRSGVESALYDDCHRYLPDTLMRKSDTAAMHSALEVRSPFLDPMLAAQARSTRVSSLMPRGQRKGLLRNVARKYFPSEIVDRPKMGFAIPIGEWFRSDFGGMRTLLLDRLGSREPFGPPSLGIDLNMAYVRQMLDEHLGTGPSGLVKRDHSQRLYMLLVLSIWAEWLGNVGKGK